MKRPKSINHQKRHTVSSARPRRRQIAKNIERLESRWVMDSSLNSSEWILDFADRANFKDAAAVQRELIQADLSVQSLRSTSDAFRFLATFNNDTKDAVYTKLDSLYSLVGFEENQRVIAAERVPDDAQLSQQYAIKNNGANGGVAGADVNVTKAWDQTIGSRSVVTAFIDSGIDYTHEDLYQNIWINQGEIPKVIRDQLKDTDGDGIISFLDLNSTSNASLVRDRNGNVRIDAGDLLSDPAWINGVDEDGELSNIPGTGRTKFPKTYIDDLFGWDFVDDDNNPFDANGHGSHVAGIAAAQGNNGIGISGISWQASIMPLRFLDGLNQGSLLDATEAMDYMNRMKHFGRANVRIANTSWGVRESSKLLSEEVRASGDEEILVVAAAGNGSSLGIGLNLEQTPFYPAAFTHSNILSVAASDRSDRLAVFSNYGPDSVDLVAPGVDIVSVRSGGDYVTRSGTSMSAAFVSGAAALLWQRVPDARVSEIVAAIRTSVKKLGDLQGMIATQGRLDIGRAVIETDTFSPRAALVSAPDVTTADSEYFLEIEYTDDQALYQSLDLQNPRPFETFNIEVLRDGDITEPLQARSAEIVGDPTPTKVRVRYRIEPKTTVWRVSENGTYQVRLRDSSLSDVAGNVAIPKSPSASQILGSFTVELQVVPNPNGNIYSVNTQTDSIDVDPSDNVCLDSAGKCSLRAAVMQANAVPGEDTILLPPGEHVLSRTQPVDQDDSGADFGDLDITDSLIVIGDSGGTSTIDGQQQMRLFQVAEDVSLLLHKLTLKNGKAEPSNTNPQAANVGGAILSFGNLTVSESNLNSNLALDSGGAIAVLAPVDSFETPRLNILDSSFSKNQASFGGGVSVRNATAFVRNSTFLENIADVSGGGIDSDKVQRLIISRSVFQSNKADLGGGMTLAEGSSVVFASNVIGNSAKQSGGIFVTGNANATINQTQFFANTTVGDGGAIGLNSGSLNLLNSSIGSNAAQNGGGISASGKDAFLTASQNQIFGNQATDSGGGISLNGILNFTIMQSLIEFNHAKNQGGGISTSSTSGDFNQNRKLNQLTIQENSSESFGGGLALGGDEVLQDSTVINNRSTGIGGGVIVFGSPTLLNSVITQNRSETFGGGLAVSFQVTLGSTAIYDNISATGEANVANIGEIISLGNNLIGSSSGSTAGTTGSNVNTLSGQVFADLDNSLSKNASDQPFAGVRVYLDRDNSKTFSPGDPFAFSDANGEYVFRDLEPGKQYVVGAELPTDFLLTLPDPTGAIKPEFKGLWVVALGENDLRTGLDFGFTPNVGGVGFVGSVSGRLYEDRNESRTFDTNDVGLVGIRVFADLNQNGLYDSSPTPEPSAMSLPDDLATANFNEAGTYRIPNLAPGNYQILTESPVSMKVNSPITNSFESRASANRSKLDSPGFVVTDDFNQDGRSDLVVSDPQTSPKIYYLQADGTYQEKILPGNYSGAGQVAVGRFNNDPWPDLAIMNSQADFVTVLISQSANTYSALSIAASLGQTDVATGDLDGDQRDDLIVSARNGTLAGNPVAASLRVYRNPGNGLFANPTVITGANLGGTQTILNPQSITVGDFVGDNRLDVAIAVYEVAEKVAKNDLGFLENKNGVLSFHSSLNLDLADPQIESKPLQITTARINQDSFDDLAMVDIENNRVAVLLANQNTKGTFQPTTVINGLYRPSALFAADLDQDNDQDLIVAAQVNSTNASGVNSSGNAQLFVIPNPGNGQFSSESIASGFTGFVLPPSLPRDIAPLIDAQNKVTGFAVTRNGNVDLLSDKQSIGNYRVAVVGQRNLVGLDFGFVTVHPNQPPQLTSSTNFNVPENSTAITQLTATDSNVPAQTLVYSLIPNLDASKFQLTSTGVLSFVSGTDFEAPTDSDQNNTYLVIVQVSDSENATDTETITVTIQDVNEPPQATPVSEFANSGKTISVALQGTDPEKGTLQVQLITMGKGSLVFDGSRFIYTPLKGFTGLDTFEFVVTDGSQTSTSAKLEILVIAPYRNPDNPFDVDGLNGVQSLDALLIINRLNAGDTQLPEIGPAIKPLLYVDTDGDGTLAPLDALLVINELNRGSAQSEPTSPSSNLLFISPFEFDTSVQKKKTRSQPDHDPARSAIQPK